MPASTNPVIAALNTIGQSVWYDNLSRDVLRSGELARLIGLGVSGLTSNPTIFKQAIADTADYDDLLARPGMAGLSAEGVAEELMVGDVAAAADLLRPVHDATAGADGHASIEVSPDLADSTAGTIAAAERLWRRLDRPNVMIKIPATEAGIPAVRGALERGINVNVTLIFSVPVYERVVDAHLGALEARLARGEPLAGLASVASFFVSRVDGLAEKRLDALVGEGRVAAADRDALVGRVGIANARAAYAAFERRFGSDRFRALAAAGARVQRPLWASTGTKNPALSPVAYVEALAGPATVNTMPPATLTATLAGAEIRDRLHDAPSDHQAVLARLEECGVPVDALLGELAEAGVESFRASYRQLLDSIEARLRRGR